MKYEHEDSVNENFVSEEIPDTSKTKTKAKHPLLNGGMTFVPYIKELKQLVSVKSTNACIVMAQLEYWMSRSSAGHLIKYLAPPEKTTFYYKPGQSWIEELGISKEEFRTAFRQIGVVYKSKAEYNEARKAGNEFRGKFYLSYHQKPTKSTFYFRNDKLVDYTIRALLGVSEDRKPKQD